MPRRERFIVPGMAHHVTQRGNNRQAVFEIEEDYKQYCHWVNQYATTNGVEIVAFCLMTNHVHFIVIPRDKGAIGRTFNTVQMRHAQYMNKKRERSGHVWQGRYFCCILDEAHLYSAVRYVENNPVRAKMVKEATDYVWSSARWHSGLDREPRIFMENATIVDKKDWQEYLEKEDEDFNEEFRKKTHSGLALGGVGFVEKLEQQWGCMLRERKPGRQHKG